MIRYQLRCSHGHGFEGWFKSSAAFDHEVQALTCPLCDDPAIEKAIMAPAVLQRTAGKGQELENRSGADAQPAGATQPPGDAQPPAGPSGGASLPASAGAVTPTPVAAMPAPGPSPDQIQLARALIAMRKLRAHVETHFENVGRRFADEARKIHYEEGEPRGIYGQATPDEVSSLEDEGIAVAPLPNLPKLDG